MSLHTPDDVNYPVFQYTYEKETTLPYYPKPVRKCPKTGGLYTPLHQPKQKNRCLPGG